MAVILEGGCLVAQMREGELLVKDNLAIWQEIGRTRGAQAISLRTLEFANGLSPGICNPDCDEIFYVLEAPESDEPASFFIDGWPYGVRAETGIYLQPGATLAVNNPGPKPLVLISSQCPEPRTSSEFVPAVTSPAAQTRTPEHPPVVRLADREIVPTGDRYFRVLVDSDVGSSQVTQFVGSIPPGRAPAHFHEYEEVLLILHGTGRMWAGRTHAAIAVGSCVYLPKGQIHCVENIGSDELRLLGVFYPAGSPSARQEVS